jgi:ATP-dependent DNA helicase RecG
MQLADSIRGVKGIGPQRQSLLTAAGIHQVRDFLTYLPYTYEDSSQILTISQAYDFVQKQPEWKSTVVKIAVKCTAEKCSVIRTKRGLTLISATFLDKTEGKKIKALWFNQSYIQNEIQQGSEYVLFGKN